MGFLGSSLLALLVTLLFTVSALPTWAKMVGSFGHPLGDQDTEPTLSLAFTLPYISTDHRTITIQGKLSISQQFAQSHFLSEFLHKNDKFRFSTTGPIQEKVLTDLTVSFITLPVNITSPETPSGTVSTQYFASQFFSSSSNVPELLISADWTTLEGGTILRWDGNTDSHIPNLDKRTEIDIILSLTFSRTYEYSQWLLHRPTFTIAYTYSVGTNLETTKALIDPLSALPRQEFIPAFTSTPVPKGNIVALMVDNHKQNAVLTPYNDISITLGTIATGFNGLNITAIGLGYFEYNSSKSHETLSYSQNDGDMIIKITDIDVYINDVKIRAQLQTQTSMTTNLFTSQITLPYIFEAKTAYTISLTDSIKLTLYSPLNPEVITQHDSNFLTWLRLTCETYEPTTSDTDDIATMIHLVELPVVFDFTVIADKPFLKEPPAVVGFNSGSKYLALTYNIKYPYLDQSFGQIYNDFFVLGFQSDAKSVNINASSIVIEYNITSSSNGLFLTGGILKPVTMFDYHTTQIFPRTLLSVSSSISEFTVSIIIYNYNTLVQEDEDPVAPRADLFSFQIFRDFNKTVTTFRETGTSHSLSTMYSYARPAAYSIAQAIDIVTNSSQTQYARALIKWRFNLQWLSTQLTFFSFTFPLKTFRFIGQFKRCYFDTERIDNTDDDVIVPILDDKKKNIIGFTYNDITRSFIDGSSVILSCDDVYISTFYNYTAVAQPNGVNIGQQISNPNLALDPLTLTAVLSITALHNNEINLDYIRSIIQPNSDYLAIPSTATATLSTVDEFSPAYIPKYIISYEDYIATLQDGVLAADIHLFNISPPDRPPPDPPGPDDKDKNFSKLFLKFFLWSCFGLLCFVIILVCLTIYRRAQRRREYRRGEKQRSGPRRKVPHKKNNTVPEKNALLSYNSSEQAPNAGSYATLDDGDVVGPNTHHQHNNGDVSSVFSEDAQSTKVGPYMPYDPSGSNLSPQQIPSSNVTYDKGGGALRVTPNPPTPSRSKQSKSKTKRSRGFFAWLFSADDTSSNPYQQYSDEINQKRDPYSPIKFSREGSIASSYYDGEGRDSITSTIISPNSPEPNKTHPYFQYIEDTASVYNDAASVVSSVDNNNNQLILGLAVKITPEGVVGENNAVDSGTNTVEMLSYNSISALDQYIPHGGENIVREKEKRLYTNINDTNTNQQAGNEETEYLFTSSRHDELESSRNSPSFLPKQPLLRIDTQLTRHSTTLNNPSTMTHQEISQDDTQHNHKSGNSNHKKPVFPTTTKPTTQNHKLHGTHHYGTVHILANNSHDSPANPKPDVISTPYDNILQDNLNSTTTLPMQAQSETTNYLQSVGERDTNIPILTANIQLQETQPQQTISGQTKPKHPNKRMVHQYNTIAPGKGHENPF